MDNTYSPIKHARCQDWTELADRVLSGYCLDESDALAVLESRDEELLEVLSAAFKGDLDGDASDETIEQIV